MKYVQTVTSWAEVKYASRRSGP